MNTNKAETARISFWRSGEPAVLRDGLEVLDMDGSGTINFDEFLHGTLRPFATGPSDPGWRKDL